MTTTSDLLGTDDPHEAERRARMALARLTDPLLDGAYQEIAGFGHVEAVVRLLSGSSSIKGRAATRVAHFDLEADLRATRWSASRVIVPGDDEWPDALDELERPPHCLWLRGSGRLDELTERGVAVVGARGATAYGEHVASEIGFGLTAARAVVVSGAAYGIDGAAHRGALAAEGPTVAALACGIDRAYPLVHSQLLVDIADGGVVLTEAPPGTAPLRSRFLARNRMIAALSRGTVVVEAGLRSGSLNTARWAGELHRPVMAVPGPVTSASSAGAHELLRETDAVLVTGADDVLEQVGRMGEHLVPLRRSPERPQDALDPEEFAVWEALSRSRTSDATKVSLSAGLELIRAQTLLATLEARGLAEHDGRGWLRV